MSVILLPDKWRRQPSGPVAINEALWPGRAQAFLPSLGYNGVISAGAGSGRIVTLQNANAPFTLRKNGKVVHAYRPNSSTDPGESFKWQTPDFDVGPNASMVFYGYTLLDNYGVALEYGGSNWGLLLNIDTGSDVRGSYVDSPTTAQFDATISGAAPAVGVPITVGLIKSGNAVTVVTSSQQATTTGGNGGIRRSAGSGFGIEYNSSSYVGLMLGAVSSVPLSIGQMREILNAPYAIFRKQPRILYFDLGAGGGATIAGDSGTYALTGSDVSLKAGRKLAADSGSYSLSGTDAAFKRGYALVASSGTYTVSGTAVSLKAGRKLAADSGSYTLTGTDATLTYAPAGSYNLTAESGSYSLTGTAATLRVSRKLSADSGAYSLTGTTATLAKGVRMAAASGIYTLTGSNVSFARTYVLTAESGSYTLTGTSAGLTWSGAPVVEVPTNGGPSIYGKPVFREREFRREYEEQVKRIEDEKRLARILREDEEITVIMALMAA